MVILYENVSCVIIRCMVVVVCGEKVHVPRAASISKHEGVLERFGVAFEMTVACVVQSKPNKHVLHQGVYVYHVFVF